MTSVGSTIVWTFYGPRLLRILKHDNNPGYAYQPNIVESFSDRIVHTIKMAFNTAYWCSPVVAAMMYRRGYFTHDGIQGVARLALSVVAVYALAYFFRGIGRLNNADYRRFINSLVLAKANPSIQTKQQLAHFDFEFWAWPVDFQWNTGREGDKKNARGPTNSTRKAQAVDRSSFPCKILGYLAMHTFGQKMVYPGSTSIMNYLLSNMLSQGRAQLVDERGGKRAKILTEDKNELDTMFMDRRHKHRNGETLVITSEGNGGFYEMGCSGTPIELNYSVLGWNRPGFGGSSGTPWPEAEQKAIEAVVMYAINELGFEPQNIALFAWSIGGYSAALMAKSFPDIKFVVLDATFDDLVPLAVSKMPESWGSLVAQSIRSYMDLNVAEHLNEYKGPFLLIRRTKDEMISTDAPPDRHPNLATNRGNNLLLKLLQFRYPNIVDNTTLPVMREFLSIETYRQVQMLNERDFEECQEVFTNYVSQNGVHFPMSIDVDELSLKEKLALFLVSMHMVNFDSTHNAPLPSKFFREPWVPGARL